MAVNMAYVPKPESGTKVLKMTLPWNGGADIALTFESKSNSLPKLPKLFRKVA